MQYEIMKLKIDNIGSVNKTSSGCSASGAFVIKNRILVGPEDILSSAQATACCNFI